MINIVAISPIYLMSFVETTINLSPFSGHRARQVLLEQKGAGNVLHFYIEHDSARVKVREESRAAIERACNEQQRPPKLSVGDARHQFAD